MNTLNILRAFAEGLRLIITPCVLPILPIVLAASLDGGRRRPYGVAFGFAFMLIGLSVFSREVFAAIDNQTIKMIALVFLLGLGLYMLFPTVTEWKRAKKEGEDHYAENLSYRWDQDNGFLSGLAIGFLIALAWTPCAGPVMAEALEEVRSRTDPEATSIIALYAIGAGLPMLILSLLLRWLIKTFPYLNERGFIVRAILGLIIMISIAGIFFGLDKQLLPSATRGAGIQIQKPPPPIKGELPAIDMPKPPELPKLKSLPTIKLPSRTIKPPTETIPPPPIKPLGELGKQPQRSIVPQEPTLPKVEAPPPDLTGPVPLHFGLNTKNYVGENERQSENVQFYDPASDIPVGNWSLIGRWRMEKDKIVSASPGATLRARFKARRLYAVMSMPDQKVGKASIFINRKPITDLAGKDVINSNVHIKGQATYELVNQPDSTEAELDIVACVPNLEIRIVTFKD